MAKKPTDPSGSAPKKPVPPTDRTSTYTSLKRAASAEFIEKKSRFIGYAAPVTNEEEAAGFIRSIREKHADATHNVYAYILRGGAVARFSDDGEPQGTAGMPVLEVIKKSGADHCVVVVTRYFGGILLGAGGLVRAYAHAAKLALDAAEIVVYEAFTEFMLVCDYSAYTKISAELPKYAVVTDGEEFGAQVELKLAVKAASYAAFCDRIQELFAGRLTPEMTGERFGC